MRFSCVSCHSINRTDDTHASSSLTFSVAYPPRSRNLLRSVQSDMTRHFLRQLGSFTRDALFLTASLVYADLVEAAVHSYIVDNRCFSGALP